MSKSSDKDIEDRDFKHKELEASEPEYICELCQDTESIEIMGGSDSDEWGVVGLKRCSCQDE